MAQDADTIVKRILGQHDGELIAIGAPIAQEKKGIFAKELKRAATKGFSTALIDGIVTPLNPLPILAKETKHTIVIIVDHIKIKDAAAARLTRSIASALEETEGFGVYYQASAKGEISLATATLFSKFQGCQLCGFSWPKLDSRHFAPNSLGRCKSCDGYGYLNHEDLQIQQETSETSLSLQQLAAACDDCKGTGISDEMQGISYRGVSIHDLMTKPISPLLAIIQDWQTQEVQRPAVLRVLQEIGDRLLRLREVGLGHITLSRRITTLSGGESQRMRIAGILSAQLRNVLYVLDEPSQGLHPQEIRQLCQALDRLIAEGNTVILVDHDEAIMRHADLIIDLGPGGGQRGGEIMAKFHPRDAKHFIRQSRTAAYLAEDHRKPERDRITLSSSTRFVTIKRPRLLNLKMDRVRFPVGALSVVSGVSGAGKSSLVLSLLYENLCAKLQNSRHKFAFCDGLEGIEGFSRCELVDRRPLAKTSSSMPATYLGFFTDIRNFFGTLPDAQILGLTPSSFSLSREGGRCEDCKGRGEINLEMKFLSDARIPCHTCGGRRYQAAMESVRYNGHSIADVLAMTLDELATAFSTFRQINRKLQSAIKLGLGYLKAGQPSSSLSGGEAQRLKLANLFTARLDSSVLVLMDEPTAGLHFEDVGRLTESLSQLVKNGATAIVIEHNPDVIAAADWLCTLGPGAADAGGQLVHEGPPNTE
jgi:excinuclease ABC subunit A